MLEHSPSLPLFIDYHLDSDLDTKMIAEAEKGIILALKQRDRVRRVRFLLPVPITQRLIRIIEEEYPVLEYLIINPSTTLSMTASILSETFQAPRLRHLTLRGPGLPIGSRLLTTAVGIVTLYLFLGHTSSYIQPHTLLQWLSFMPQLETLRVDYIVSPLYEVKRQLVHAPAMTHVTFPNLRWFEFQGPKAYVEAVVCRITTPRLEKLDIQLIMELPMSVPGLLQFMNTTENLRFDSADFEFCKICASAKMYLRGQPKAFALSVTVIGFVLDIQVAGLAEIFNSLGQKLSTVEYLTLKYKELEYNEIEIDRTGWRNLLGSFGNVKTLRVDEELVEAVSHCLQVDEGDSSPELLPELWELSYSAMGNTYGPFKSFIDTRKKAGRPVILICHTPWSATLLS